MSIKYNNTVYEMKQYGKDVLVLSLGEAYFDIPLFPFSELPFPDLYHYSHSRGIIKLREKLSNYFENQYNFKFNPESEILITSGSKIAIYMVLKAILNKDDEVIIPEPLWVSYPEQVKLCSGIPVAIPQDISIFDFENYINSKTKAIIITNPHNPTGYIYAKEELIYLFELAQKYDLWLLSDEAYSDFVNDNSFCSLGSIDVEKSNTIVFNSISKNYGISGWRLGYAISNEKLIFNILKINQHLITCPATILENYVEKYFDKILEITKPQIFEVVEKRNRIVKFIDSLGMNYKEGTATFYIFLSILPTELSSEEFCNKLLEEELISVVPGIGYGKSCDKFVRISIGTESEEKIKFALIKIKELIYKTQSRLNEIN
jgi:aspartate aminotransferase/aminotransferase